MPVTIADRVARLEYELAETRTELNRHLSTRADEMRRRVNSNIAEAMRLHPSVADSVPVAPLFTAVLDYVEYLARGGAPIRVTGDSDREKLREALSGFRGAMDWLADEPDQYSEIDGEPV